MADSPRKLRSSDWFGGAGKNNAPFGGVAFDYG